MGELWVGVLLADLTRGFGHNRFPVTNQVETKIVKLGVSLRLIFGTRGGIFLKTFGMLTERLQEKLYLAYGFADIMSKLGINHKISQNFTIFMLCKSNDFL